MKKFFAVAILLIAGSTWSLCDQINFNFTTGANGSVTASGPAGLSSGPSDLTDISNSTTGVIFPFTGTYVHGNTGPATSFVVGTMVVATFGAAGANSVFSIDGGGMTLVSGTMRDGASLLSTVPAGTGSFLGTFDVSFVDPAALALFGLSPTFEPVGSVAFTFANANVSGGVLTAAIGGGAVTIQTPTVTPVPEIATLLLVGTGLLLCGGYAKRRGVIKFA